MRSSELSNESIKYYSFSFSFSYECERSRSKKMTYSFFLRKKGSPGELSSYVHSDLHSRDYYDRTSGSLLCLDSERKCNEMIQYPYASVEKSRTFFSGKSARYSYRRRTGGKCHYEFSRGSSDAKCRSACISGD